MSDKRYTKHDWRLFNAVAKFKPLRDGIILVSVRGDWQEVSCYGNVIFRRNATSHYWEAATWGSTHDWLLAKINACLHAVNANMRLYADGRRFNIVSADGATRKFRDSFNSEVFK